MARRSLSQVVLVVLLLLAVGSEAAARRRPRDSFATFTPPAEPGFIYVVVDFARSAGTAQPTGIALVWGRLENSGLVSPSYSCRTTTPGGAVVRIRHRTADTTPLSFGTTGTIIRGPYQGDNPPEQLHACYRLVKFL